MRRATRIAFAYAVAFFAFLILPVVFRFQASWPFPSGVDWQEVLDLFTPLVLIPLSWLLCSFEDDEIPASRAERLVFLVFAALWVEGQGMHLASNSIGRPWEHDLSPSGALAHYYDDILSHYVWHLGIAGTSALAIVRSLSHPYREGRLSVVLVATAALLFGVSWFCVLIESGTEPFAIPFTVAMVAYVLLAQRRRLGASPIAAVLGLGYALTLILIAVWALIWHGLPQFTEVGWI